jgi:predicted permease
VTLFVSTLEAVAVLLALGVLGFALARQKTLPEQTLGVLGGVALDVALPSLVFSSVLQRFQPEISPDWWRLPLWWAAMTLFNVPLTCLAARMSRPASRREFAISLFFQNGLFFPYAVIAGLFGETSPLTVDLFIFTLFYPSLFFSGYPYFFAGSSTRPGEGVAGPDWSKILNRVLIATVAAVSLRLGGVGHWVPDFLAAGIEMVGEMALPLLLIILGGNVFVDFRGRGPLFPMEMAKFILAKNLLFPLLTLAALWLVRPPHPAALLILLQAASPPITAVPIVVDRCGGDRNIANQFNFSSMAAAAITVPIMVTLFNHLFSMAGESP